MCGRSSLRRWVHSASSKSGLASRAPYFHNGTAANLAQVVEFYNQRFQMHLTGAEKADLLAFLKTL